MAQLKKKKNTQVPFISMKKLTLSLDSDEQVTGRVFSYEDSSKCLILKVLSEESLQEYKNRETNFPDRLKNFFEYERFSQVLVLNTRNVEVVKNHKEDDYNAEKIDKINEQQQLMAQIITDAQTYRGIGKHQ